MFDYGLREYGYGGGPMGYGGGKKFVGVLDRLSTQPESAWSFARRMSARYGGPVGRLYRLADGVEADIYGMGRLGLVSPAAVRAFGGWNLISHSSAFTSANWSKVQLIGIVDGYSSDPFGNPAANIIPNNVNEQHRIERSTTSMVAGRTYCFSANIKAFGYGFAWLRNCSSYCIVNLSTGQLSSVTGTARATSIGDGWWTVELIATAAGSDACRINVLPAANFDNFAGDQVKGILVAAAQLERGTSRSAYRPTGSTADSDVLWSSVYDQTGAGRTFAQSTAALMPIAARQGVPVTENGIQAAEFVAADARRMSIASSASLYSFLHTTGGCIGAVAKANNTASSKMLLANNSASNEAGFSFARNGSEALDLTAARRNVAGVATNGRTVGCFASSMTGTTANVLSIAILDPDNPTAASRASLYENGILNPATNSDTATPFVENAVGNLTLGANASGTAAFDGTISEVPIWQSLLSADRLIYEADALDLWSIA